MQKGMHMFSQPTDSNQESWRVEIAKYQHSDFRRSVWQIINSFGPYFALLYLMYRSLDVSYWIALTIAFLAAGFQVRTFIIFHDCGHGSFFKSHRANDIVGIVSGLFTFTPYYEWRHNHALHHATGSDLDRRGIGDVWMLTVKEYNERTPWQRFVYRFYRNPFVMFGIGPLFMVFISHRFTSVSSGPREKKNVYWTNITLAVLVAVVGFTIGFTRFILIFLPTIWIAGMFGLWLFYVQHQYEGVYWARHEDWNFYDSALKGSSFYNLPKVLQWFSGNIGFHHIHHLSPRIPNYTLSKCQNELPLFSTVRPITLLLSLHSLALRLWDEERHELVGFSGVQNISRST
jgi:omega-6 fatty acid desaturase (delta-12 desaturase)